MFVAIKNPKTFPNEPNRSATDWLFQCMKSCFTYGCFYTGKSFFFPRADPTCWEHAWCSHCCSCKCYWKMEQHIFLGSPSISGPPQFCYSILEGGNKIADFFSQNIMGNLPPHAIPLGGGEMKWHIWVGAKLNRGSGNCVIPFPPRNDISGETQVGMGTLWMTLQNLPFHSPQISFHLPPWNHTSGEVRKWGISLLPWLRQIGRCHTCWSVGSFCKRTSDTNANAKWGRPHTTNREI